MLVNKSKMFILRFVYIFAEWYLYVNYQFPSLES